MQVLGVCASRQNVVKEARESNPGHLSRDSGNVSMGQLKRPRATGLATAGNNDMSSQLERKTQVVLARSAQYLQKKGKSDILRNVTAKWVNFKPKK